VALGTACATIADFVQPDIASMNGVGFIPILVVLAPLTVKIGRRSSLASIAARFKREAAT
jgi:hypothetical protein